MAVYQRGNGGHVAEREQPEPGSDREKELEALVESDKTDWTRVEGSKKRRNKKKDDSESGQGEGGEAGEGGSDSTETAERPAKNASQEAWAAYAVTQGADEGEAKAATRDDLIKAYGG